MTNYDKIATIYDSISRLFLGKNIVQSQVCILQYIPANSSILIVGGGTGWVLEEITRLHEKGLMIDYVDSSMQMIALAKKKNIGENSVSFINLPIEYYATKKIYDVIFTPFLFDNFNVDKIAIVFTKLHLLLKNNGLWLYVDFVYDEKRKLLWQKILLKIMYFFFKITCNIETQQLFKMDYFFDPYFNKIIELPHYNNFIHSIVYTKK